MYGDTDVIGRRADLLRERAGDLQSWADRLVAQTQALAWTGRAADAMHSRVGERATRIRSSAARHEQAADALVAHRHAVDELTEQITQIEERVDRLVADARGRLAAIAAESARSGVRIDPEADDGVLDSFTPPPRGHRSWLEVELPGLRSGP